MSSDLEDPNKADAWKSTNSHEVELVIAYNINTVNNALCPRIFYALYIGPNNNGNGCLIYKLSTDQILVTMKYQSVPVPEDLIEAINKVDLSNNKIQVDHVNSEDSIVQDEHSNNNKDQGQTQFKYKDSSVDKSHGKLDSSQKS